MLRVLALGVGMLMTSCAYVQTHKNVEEIGAYYEGELLSTATSSLYKKGESWYISAQKAKFKLVYPTIHDSVFRRSDYDPRYELIENSSTTVYHSISQSAAEVLMNPKGYYELNALAEEITRSPGTWESSLDHAEQHAIQANIGGQSSFSMKNQRVPAKKSLFTKAIGTADFVVVDIPLSVAYNVAIPVMAPFVFFYEFLCEE